MLNPLHQFVAEEVNHLVLLAHGTLFLLFFLLLLLLLFLLGLLGLLILGLPGRLFFLLWAFGTHSSLISFLDETQDLTIDV